MSKGNVADFDLNRIHQDIKPENIVICSHASSDSEYDRNFKLVDLGSTHYNETLDSKGQAVIRDNNSTQQFSKFFKSLS